MRLLRREGEQSRPAQYTAHRNRPHSSRWGRFHYMDDFLEWKQIHAPWSARNYRQAVQQFSLFLKGREPSLSDYTRFIQIKSMKYKDSTISLWVAALKQYALWNKEERKGIVNPSMIRWRRCEESKRIYADRNDVQALCSQLDEWEFWSLRKIVCFSLLWDTGIRISELCDLNVSDIDTRLNFTEIIRKKGKRRRVIMWSKNTHKLLIRYLGSRICINQGRALFIAKIGHKRITTRSVERWVAHLRGAKAITPHSMRHGKAHIMLAKGANVKHIQMVLGHSEQNPNAAFQYLRLDEKEQIEVLERFVD